MVRRKSPFLLPFPSLLQLQAWPCPAEPEPPDLTKQEHLSSLTPTVGRIQDDPWCPGAPACMRLLRALDSHWGEQVWARAQVCLHHSHDIPDLPSQDEAVTSLS